MSSKRIVPFILLCLVVAVLVLSVCEQASAQGKSTTSADRNTAQRRGLEPVDDGDKDAGLGPNKLQKIVGVGSIFVMIAVVKWL